MNDSYNKVEDFLTDELFRSWVTNPTPEIESHWDLWLGNHPEKKEMVLEAKKIVKGLEFSVYKPDSEIKEHILKNIKSETPNWNRPKQKQVDLFQYWSKIAAILIFSVGIGSLIFYLNKPTDNKAITSNNMIVKKNPMGVRSHYVLSDGSEIFLNAGSVIEFPEKFDSNQRIVKLLGEAYFEVQPDISRPFKVVSDKLTVTVLGTKFNFNSDYQSNSVALVEGKVMYSENHSSLDTILIPGQMAKFDENRSRFSLSDFDEEKVIGWKDGKLIFRDASFDEVVNDLKKWYGVTIAIKNKSSKIDWSYTASFSNESLETVLLNMSTVKGFDYKISRKEVTISFAD